MMNILKTVSAVTFAAVALFSLGSAQANVITGRLWHVPEAVVNSPTGATVANVPGTTPDVTFDVNSPMNFNATTATVAAWLATSSAFNIVQNTAGTLASLMDNGISGTILEFTGFVTVTTGQMFTVTHDDGLTLIIGGLNLGFNPGPTAPAISTATYTGPSGNFAFTLVYAECCGGPAVLQVALPFSNAVPEPTSLALLGIGLAAIGFSRRRMQS
jgi:PEP-CTERM motif